MSTKIGRNTPVGPYFDQGFKRVHCPRVAVYRAIGRFLNQEDAFGGTFNQAIGEAIRLGGFVNPAHIEVLMKEIFRDWGFEVS